MGFAQDWTNAKKNFENKTKQKKPSEKVLGVFRKSSGLEKATQALDNALNKCDLADMDRAAKGYATASSAYQDLLSRTDSQEKGSEYKDQIVVLDKALDTIGDNFEKAWSEQLLKQVETFSQLLQREQVTVEKLREQAEHECQGHKDQLESVLAAVMENKVKDAQQLASQVTLSCKKVEKFLSLVDELEKLRTGQCDRNLKAWGKFQTPIGRSNGQYEGKVQTIKKALSSIDQDEVLIKGSVQTAQKNAKEAANILAKGKQTLDLLVSKVKKLRDDLEFFKMDYGKHIKEFESSCENWTERLADVYKDPKSSIQEKAKSRDRIIKLATELGDKVPNWQKEVEQSTKEYHQRWQECPRKVCMSSKFPAHADVQALLLALLELQKAGATAVRLQLLVNQLVDKAKTYGEQK